MLLSALVVGLLQVAAPGGLMRIEQIVGDWSWRLGASAKPERRIVVVDIDEASLKQVGPWPWPRSTMARLSQRLEEAGAVVQAYDIAYSDPMEGDAALAATWSQAPVVVGQIFSLDAQVTPRVGTVAGSLAAGGCPAFAPRSQGHYGIAPGLLEPAPALGHITPRVESDGVVRKVPALVCHEGRAYPSLALATLWRVAQPTGTGPVPAPDWVWSQASEQAYGVGLAPAGWLTSPSLPGLVVPVDAQGDMIVPYRAERRAFASVSAADVLNGTAEASLLRGTVALIGATAFGFGDRVATPHAAVSSGVEVHAQSIVGLLDHRIPYAPTSAALLQAAAAVLVAAALLALVRRRPGVTAKRLPLAGVLLAVGCYSGAAWALLQHDLWLPWASVAVFALVSSSALAAAEHALTRAQRERLSAHLGAYLPAPVAQRLMASDPSGSVQVNRRDISVLVADIRNFSSFAAHKPAEETAAMLHAFCCIAVDVVEQHGGVVENVVGDSVLAVWNAYSDCPDHPKQALLAAQELLRATRTLLAPSQLPHEDSPVQPLALGVGLESGIAVVGSFGPARRRAHAALGEPVSVAARLQQMTLDLSMPILIGPQLASQLPQGSTEPLGEYLLEGLSRQYALHAPTAWAELVPAEPLWASAATATERGTDGLKWAGWSDTGSPASLQIQSAANLRDA
ncbi:MAG: adenylate/guanylate cyclase domain-containing protein [Burkholderiales bacterium]|nr:adenylate/guanylate cyclase domain-containing protein [Burkholderiales bacterium]